MPDRFDETDHMNGESAVTGNSMARQYRRWIATEEVERNLFETLSSH